MVLKKINPTILFFVVCICSCVVYSLFFITNISAQELQIQEIIIEDFEIESNWSAKCINNTTDIELRIRRREFALSSNYIDTGEYVLGLKLDFFDVDKFKIAIGPLKPLSLGKGVKTLSAMIYGNNFSHVLSVLVKDINTDQTIELLVGQLNWMGWKEITVVIPNNITPNELAFMGFKLYCNPLLLSRGVLYFYFDNIKIKADGYYR